MAADGLHIAISAEELFSLGSVSVANTLFTSFLVTGALVAFLFYAKSQLKQTTTPNRFQSLLEMIVEGLVGLVEDIAGHGKKAAEFLPLIAGFFVFILLNNWVEQIPGIHTITFTGDASVRLVDLPAWMNPDTAYASTATTTAEDASEAALDTHSEQPVEDHSESATEEISGHESDTHEGEESGEHKDEHASVALFRGPNADLNMTLALALITVAATQFFGLKYAGLGYLQKFFNFSSPINAFIGLLELIGEFSKIISFAFRLFGNIFAGEVLISVMYYLMPVVIPMPFIGFELFVGALQAYVFAMLSLVFYNMAASEAHH